MNTLVLSVTVDGGVHDTRFSVTLFDIELQFAAFVTVKLKSYVLPPRTNSSALLSIAKLSEGVLLTSFHTTLAPAPAPVVSATRITGEFDPSSQILIGPAGETTATEGAGVAVIV